MSQNTVTLEQLKEQCQELSLEAITYDGFSYEGLDKIANMFDSVKTFLFDRISKKEKGMNLFNVRSMSKNMEKLNYGGIRRIEVYIPPGLNTTYMAHIETLRKNQEIVDRLIEGVLKPYYKYLGTLLADPEELQSNRHTNAGREIMTHDLEEVRERVRKNFDTNKQEIAMYGDLIESQAQWKPLLENFNDLIERVVSNVPLKMVDKYVTDTSELMDVLVKRIEEDPEMYSTSGVVVSDISAITYEIANEIEHYVVHRGMIETMIHSVNRAYKLVK